MEERSVARYVLLRLFSEIDGMVSGLRCWGC